MLLSLSPDQVVKLKGALRQAGKREIGGQLFGEQLAPSDFRVTELTVQARSGTVFQFVVDLVQAARDSMRFFDRTEHRYTRYNYIGEWHSHPSFAIEPSGTDLRTMREIVRDPNFTGSFAALIIARLDVDAVSAGAWLFDPSGREHPIALELRHEH